MESRTLILNEVQIQQKIKRIAFEIYENNFKEKELVIAGVKDQGYKLAELICIALKDICPIKPILISITLDKLKPTQSEILFSEKIDRCKNKSILLVDDVLNTGRTLAYSLKPFLKVRVKKIEVAVLVNRSHTEFPISAKYTGFELSTSIMEHVQVVLEEKESSAVYLR
ncbi:MAG: phosphoribosyltransferase family protein [Bacteroidota bacterium]